MRVSIVSGRWPGHSEPGVDLDNEQAFQELFGDIALDGPQEHEALL